MLLSVVLSAGTGFDVSGKAGIAEEQASAEEKLAEK